MAYLIRMRRFRPGEQIPSVRSLSAQAHINYNTVTRAYHDLEANGLIVSIRGRGMYVNRELPQEEGVSTVEADNLLADVVRQYRNAGMAFDEIKQHVAELVDRAAKEADASAERKMGYYDDASY